MKISLYTSYSITGDDGLEIKYVAFTTGEDIKSLLDIHNKKIGAMERQLLPIKIKEIK